MIAYLRGRVLAIASETAILDVNGIGYEIYCSGGAFRKLTVGETAELYTYMQVKEDGVTLFGFATTAEKELFLKITSVSGVGPKLGISVLTSMSGDELATAIATADVKRLSSAKGMGKKTAEKIVLELHGKISATEVMNASEDVFTAKLKGTATPVNKEDEEAIEALVGLGFTKNESVQAIKRARENGAKTTEEIIRKALQASF
ncbi:MAG: Holliday junction branch migration protein RuvA [Clostridiales bacterium]|nr:Holliday junction branch migration protein RuvA [Clostridiales bacterium]